LAAALRDIIDTHQPELLPAMRTEDRPEDRGVVGPYELHDFFLFHTLRMALAEKI
jgi:NAD+ synthase (glutamine-hydrolysing)